MGPLDDDSFQNKDGCLKKTGVGSHFILDLYGCTTDVLDDLPLLQRTLRDALNLAGATIITDVFHKFSPQGVTGVVVIAESHASVHTWPEIRFAAFDFFTCGEKMNPDLAIQHLIAVLMPKSQLLRQVPRGTELV